MKGKLDKEKLLKCVHVHVYIRLHALEWNWIIVVIRRQLNPRNVQLERIYIYIYETMVATSCDLNVPRCTTTVPQVRLHGSRGGVFVDHRPPRDPGDPLL